MRKRLAIKVRVESRQSPILSGLATSGLKIDADLTNR
jgi:hypothetical protein